MKIDHEALQKIAHLARLEVKPEEEADLLASMDSVLTWMEQLDEVDTEGVEPLDEVDTEGVEPLTHMSEEVNNWRADVAQNTLSREKALENAPSQDGTYIKVPKVIE